MTRLQEYASTDLLLLWRQARNRSEALYPDFIFPTISVIDNPSKVAGHAYTLGGIVFISKQLLQQLPAPQAINVIAHEVGHIFAQTYDLTPPKPENASNAHRNFLARPEECIADHFGTRIVQQSSAAKDALVAYERLDPKPLINPEHYKPSLETSTISTHPKTSQRMSMLSRDQLRDIPTENIVFDGVCNATQTLDRPITPSGGDPASPEKSK